MPSPTPLHPRTAALCSSYRFKEWAGYHAVCSYGVCHEREYYALRHAAGLIDVSPLCKLEVRGPDAGALLSFVSVRDVSRLKVGRVVYTCWCDDHGKLIDDGTIARLSPDHYRLTSNLPTYAWVARHARGHDVALEEVTQRLAALALQGPTSRRALAQITPANLDRLRYFGATSTEIAGVAGTITRTGFTGGLGYELWIDRGDALAVWDALLAEGKSLGVEPVGLDALDIARIEAGYVLAGVDYSHAQRCLVEWQTSTPLEAGLGRLVKLDREPFIGQAALAAEAAGGPSATLVGVEIDWEATERLYDRYGLPPQLPGRAWRATVPLYDDVLQVGRASSGCWSPLLKQNLALATVERAYSEPGTPLEIEWTVEHRRDRVAARVATLPFYDPPGKRGRGPSIPSAEGSLAR